jgi:hypothetical protein
LGARRGITASRWCRVRHPAGTTVTGRQRRRRWRREGRRIPRRRRRSEEVLRPGGGGDRVDGEANGPLSCRRYVTPTAASSRRCRGGGTRRHGVAVAGSTRRQKGNVEGAQDGDELWRRRTTSMGRRAGCVDGDEAAREVGLRWSLRGRRVGSMRRRWSSRAGGSRAASMG